MKKILMLLLAAALVCSLALFVACDNGEQQGTDDTTAAEETTETPESSEEVTTEEPGAQEPTDLENAAEYVRQLYKDTTVTAADYTLVSSVKVGGVSYAVTWAVNTDKITLTVAEDGTVKVDVPDESFEDIAYVLTATVADTAGNTVTKEFNRTVPKFAVTTWEQYMAAKEGDNLIVQGIVVGINSKAAGNTRNHLFLLDESGCGGYYSYQMDVDPVADLGIELGMIVRVAGPAAPYSGMMEIKGGIPSIVSTEIKSFEAIDITDKFLPETNFNEFVGMPVVIKGVTIGGQVLDNPTSQYLYFELNGVQSYVRTYVTDFPTTLKAEDKATIDAAHGAKLGYTADVTGILITYSGTPYLIPTSVDCIYNYALPERSDAEKVTLEKDNLALENTTFTANGEATLPVAGTTYPEVTITWASNSEFVVVNGDKITVTIPNETTNVKLTATLALGDATETVEFELVLVASNFTIKPVTAPEAEVAYKFYLNQVKNGYGVFVCGGINQDRYLVTSKAASEAIDIYAEANGEGYSFYTMIDGAKKYINITKNEAGKIAVLYQDAVLSVYTYVADINAWVTNVEGEADQYYLGSYNNFDTISASKTSYINAENTGVSQFPLQLVVLTDGNVSEDGNVVTNAGVEIKEGVAYYMSMNQVKNGHVVYVCGGIDQDRYLITSTDKAAALQVFVEKNGDGYSFFTTIDGAKKYINVTNNSAGKVAVLYEDTATSVYTYVSETNIWMTNLDGQDKYIGSYNNFDTMSASNTSYINAGNTGVAQFPMELILAE